MKPEQALQILEEATQPASVGKISRAGYALIEQALVVIKQLVDAQAAPPEKPKE